MSKKRPKLCNEIDEDLKDSHEQVYLRRLSTELNNAGASLQEIGYDEDALDVHREAIKVAIEAQGEAGVYLSTTYNQELKPDGNEVSAANPLIKLKKASDKVASSEVDTINKNDDEPKIKRTVIMSDPLRSHAPSCTRCQYESVILPAIMLHNVGLIYYRRERWDLALRLFEAALNIIVAEDNEDYPHGPWVFPILLNNIGHLHCLCGENDDAIISFSESERLAQEAIDALDFERSTGSHDITRTCDETFDQSSACHYQATISYNKGFVHYSQGEHKTAVECFFGALASTESPPLLFNIVVYLNYIGRTLVGRALYKDALAVFVAALRVCPKIKSKKNTLPSELHSNILVNVGFIYFRMEQHDKAVQTFLLSLRVLKRALGDRHPCVILLAKNTKFALERLQTEKESPASAA